MSKHATSRGDLTAELTLLRHRVTELETRAREAKENERNLRATQVRFELAMRGANDGLWDWDMETHEVYYSPRWKAMLGYAEDEIGNRVEDWERLLHPDDREHALDALKAYLEGRTDSYETEFRMRHKAGHDVHILSRGFGVRDAAGRVMRLVGTHVDLTERKRGEAAARESEARFRTFVEHATDGFFLFRPDGQIIDVNQRACDSLGYTRAELLTMAVPDVDIDAELHEHKTRIWDGLIVDQPVTIEGRHRRKDGSMFPVEVRLGALELRGERLLLGLARDVSKQKQAQTALQEERNRLQSIVDALDAMDQALTVVDRDFNMIFQSRISRELFGDCRGRKCHEVYECNPNICEGCPVVKSFQDGQCHVSERANTATGRLIYWENTSTPIRNVAGEIVACLEIGVDITERKRAEQALAEREEHLRLAVEAAQIGTWSWDLQTSKIRVRGVHEEALGLTDGAGVLDSEAYLEHVRAEDTERVVETARRAAEEGSPYTCEYRMIRANGEERWISAQGQPLRDENGKVTQIIGISQDITERKRAEQILAEREQHHRLALRAARIGTWNWDMLTNEVRVGGMIADTLGLDAEVATTDFDTIMGNIHPQDRTRIMDTAYRAVEQGTPYSVEYRLIQPDGSERWLMGQGQPIRDESGKVTRIIGVSQDFTERKQAEIALRERERHFRTLFERAGDAAYILDPQGNFLDVNEQACRELGYTHEEFTRLSVPDIDKEFRTRENEKWFWENLPQNEYVTFEIVHIRKDGSQYPAELRLGIIDLGDQPRLLAFSRNLTERKRAESALREREQHFRTLFEQAGDAVYILDLQANVIDANEQACRELGYTREELLRMSVPDIDRGFRTRENEVWFWENLPANEYATFEVVHTRKDGSQFPAEVKLGLIDLGNQQRPLAIARNIAERKRAEKALRDSERKYRALHESMSDAFARVNMAGRIVEVNPAYVEMIGYTPEELANLTYPELTPEKWHKLEERLVREQVLVRGDSDVYEKEYRRKDGTIFPVEMRTFLLRDDAGRPAGMWAIARDVTERKRAEQALAEREEHLRLAVRAARIGTWNWDLRTNRIRVGALAAEILNLDPKAPVTELDAILPLLHADDSERAIQTAYRAVEENTPWNSEYRIVRPDGRERWISVQGQPVVDETGKVTQMIGVTQDITERKRAKEEKEKLEAQLRQAQKMEAIGQLAGGVAHDFNNILTAIFGNVEAGIAKLQSQSPNLSAVLDGLGQIQRSAERASSLTRQLLAFSRRQVVRPEVLNLNVIVGELEKMLRRLLTENVELRLILDEALQPVEADPGQLEQVVVNLVVNARDAMPDGGELTVETGNVVLDESYVAAHADARPGAHVMLTVSDTGYGMDRATLERIFEPFFTTKPLGEGTGLGLSTVYGMVTQAGGHVAVYSEPGKGTSFRVLLPSVQKQVAATTRAHTRQSPPTGTETILLCEDDEAVRDMTTRMLKGAGYTVLAARTPQQALQLAREYTRPIDLLLTDVIMPGMSGSRLSTVLTPLRPQVRTLFMSGYTSNIIAHHGVLERNVEFLEKPFSQHTLLSRVREALDKNAQSGRTPD